MVFWTKWHFAGSNFCSNLLKEKMDIFIQISLKFVPKGPIDIMQPLVWVMDWHQIHGPVLTGSYCSKFELWFTFITSKPYTIWLYEWCSARLQYLQCISNGNYENPVHLDVIDRHLQQMGDKTILEGSPPSLELFDPPWDTGIDLNTIKVWWILCPIHQ